jgi:NADH dehydrogenase (ubiquinone) Fe-S protein 8
MGRFSALAALPRAAGTPYYAQLGRFSTTTTRHATPSGPPPEGFRLLPPRGYDGDKLSLADKAGNYFLMTELFRGMWVVMEQFFRPP